MKFRFVACVAGQLLFLVSAAQAMAAPDAASLCESAAASASRRTGVPLAVLQAISLTETGRAGRNGLQPWPWAVNRAGEGHWFSTRHEAELFVDATLAAGEDSFDVGCFQLNHRWHGNAFPSAQAMFDPEANAAYAAKFLLELHETSGNWVSAAGAYHSNTPEFAEKYKARFSRIYASLTGTAPQDGLQLAALETRQNLFPLLRSGPVGTAGSVVPLFAGSGQPLVGY